MSAHPYLDLRGFELSRAAGQLLRKDISVKIEGICVGSPDEGLLTIVCTDPDETYIYDLVELSTENRCKANLLKGDADTIRLAIEYVYDVPAALQDEPWREWLESKKFSDTSLGLVAAGQGEESVEVTGAAVEADDKLIKEAISSGSSDIHLETFDDGLIVRFRQDGVLRIVNQITDAALSRAMVKRLKVMAQMDITQDRACQGGRISVQVGNLGYDLRVSIVPVAAGESVVMRLLNKGAFNTQLTDLGMAEHQLVRYKHMIDAPFGLILTCGPTGSGKSTTLYASLKSIARPDRKILTVEDPVEYQMPGIIQVQVNMAPRDPARRVTFSTALREFLRQDPDVILVGEIRDDETAKIAIQAALTGHLVLSTIHTNDAVGVVNRLKDMNVPSYLISSTLLGSVAQRLVRRLCPDCCVKTEPDPAEVKLFRRYEVEPGPLYRAKGCEKCRNTGYRGRVGLYEVMVNSEALREQIEEGAIAQKIAATARSQGMMTLLVDGLHKSLTGLTSLEEIKRVCRDDIVT
jgi:type II secretory ATPase GspE/PulE/Tfp pilus assembly ATPase PilB-like protein